MSLKSLWIAALLACSASFAQAQEVMSFTEAKAAGYDFNEMGEKYLTAYTRGKLDTCAFPGMRDSLMQTYQVMLDELTLYLNDKRFEWGKANRGFFRLYFNEDAELEYFFYNLRGLEEKQEEKMKKLVEKFYEDYRFPMKAEMPFYIFGPAKLIDTAKK